MSDEEQQALLACKELLRKAKDWFGSGGRDRGTPMMLREQAIELLARADRASGLFCPHGYVLMDDAEGCWECNDVPLEPVE